MERSGKRDSQVSGLGEQSFGASSGGYSLKRVRLRERLEGKPENTGMKTGNKTVLMKTRARFIQAGGASPQS